MPPGVATCADSVTGVAAGGPRRPRAGPANRIARATPAIGSSRAPDPAIQFAAASSAASARGRHRAPPAGRRRRDDQAGELGRRMQAEEEQDREPATHRDHHPGARLAAVASRRGCARAPRRGEQHAGSRSGQAEERHRDQHHQDRRGGVVARAQAAVDDLELAAEDARTAASRTARRWRAGTAGRSTAARPARRASRRSAWSVLDREHARAHERVALGGRVRQHVQHDAGQRDRRAEAHPDRQDAHVLDAGVGKQPLDVPLAEHVQRGQQQRGDPEGQQRVPREAAAQRRRGDLVEPQDRVEAGREQRPGQQRGDRRRRLGVRVRQPGVHREQADLGAVAEEREQEGEPDRGVRQPRRRR